MDYLTLDDEALIRLIARGRTEALSALYDRYSRLVFSMALHTVGDLASAEEITQDVFFRIWEKASTYQAEQARVSTWLTSIARYRAIDMLRQRNVRPEKNSLGWEDVVPGSEPSIDGPEAALEQQSEQQRVRAAVLELPADQRTALQLAFFLGLTHSEIAERLGEPLGTVKTRIRLAMQKLRVVLRDDLPVKR